MQSMAPEAADSERVAGWLREHGGAVRGFLYGIVGRLDALDDMVQEVFVRAWQGRERYEERGHARAYLLQIADRVACDRFRRKKPESNLGDSVWEIGERAAGANDPSRTAAHNEAAGRLDEALEELTPLQRRALLLRYYGQLSFNEIAETLGCPLNTALSHCHRGLQMLRQHFGGDEL
jgi:RNA polymerase sigma-70 factor (ECF subfamily)